MSSEDLKHEVYEAAARKAFDDCMVVMHDILPVYGNDTSEFIFANAYVAGGILSSTLAFAQNHQDLIALRHHLLNAIVNVLDNSIAAMTPPEGKGN